MRRIDYRSSWSERRLGITLPATIPRTLRAPLGVLCCSLLLLLLLWDVERARLRAAELDGGGYARRLAAAERDVALVRAVERDVVRLRALAARVAAVRRSGATRASEIAALGDGLPDGVWLTSLRADRAMLSLEGRSTGLASVGATLTGLARLAPYSGVRLIAVHDEPGQSRLTYAIALDRRP
jgi:Tfp pilus assembly protein PilN